MRRALLLASARGARASGVGVRAREHHRATYPAFRERLAQLAARGRPALRPVGHGAAALDRRAHDRRQERRGTRARGSGEARDRRAAAEAPARPVHRALAGDVERRARRVRRLHVRRARPRAARDRRRRRAGADAHRGSRPLGVLPRSCAPRRRRGLPADRRARAAAARAPSGASTGSTGIGAVVVLETGIVAFLLRAEDALQLPFGRFLYGDLSPIAGGTRFGDGVHHDGARLRVRRGAALPRVAHRPARRCSGPCSSPASASRRDSRSRATRRPTPGTPGSPSSPTGCT